MRFGNEDEQRNALYAMNGYNGLGTKPLKICTAVPKPKGAAATQAQSMAAPSSGPSYSSGTVRIIMYNIWFVENKLYKSCRP